MNKFVVGAKKITKKLAHSRGVILVVIFVLGVSLGAGGMNLYQDKSNKNKTYKQTANSSIERNRLVNQILDKSYNRAKTQIAAAKKSGQLTDEQASKVQKKVDEAYAYRKDHVTNNKDSLTELNKKRLEWREWAKANNIPYRYFIGL